MPTCWVGITFTQFVVVLFGWFSVDFVRFSNNFGRVVFEQFSGNLGWFSVATCVVFRLFKGEMRIRGK